MGGVVVIDQMKHISDGSSTAFTFIVLLMQKQCINCVNSKIDINYWPPGT